jgi:hypothetical protein
MTSRMAGRQQATGKPDRQGLDWRPCSPEQWYWVCCGYPEEAAPALASCLSSVTSPAPSRWASHR